MASILSLKKQDDLAEKINKFSQRVRGALTKRNRIVHDDAFSAQKVYDDYDEWEQAIREASYQGWLEECEDERKRAAWNLMKEEGVKEKVNPASGEAAVGRDHIEEASFLGASSGVRLETTLGIHPPELSLLHLPTGGHLAAVPIEPQDQQHINTATADIDIWTHKFGNHTLVRVSCTAKAPSADWSRIYIRARLGPSQQITVLPVPWSNVSPDNEGFAPFEVLVSQPASIMGRSSGYAPPSIIASTVVRDSHFGAMISFFQAGDVKAARRLIDKRAIDGGADNPYATAAAGYVLLAAESNLEDLTHAQLVRLDESVPWLPDSPIILGWLSLRHGDSRSAARYFARAARRRLPIYTAGLKLLLRGLIAAQDQSDDSGVPLRRYLPDVHRYAAAVDPTNPFCTFYGRGPNSPGCPFAA